jgi:hypothetical protein
VVIEFLLSENGVQWREGFGEHGYELGLVEIGYAVRVGFHWLRLELS